MAGNDPQKTDSRNYTQLLNTMKYMAKWDIGR